MCESLMIARDKSASDMARVRALELCAELKGLRQARQASQQVVVDARSTSAVYVPTSSQLEAAGAEVKRLNAGEAVKDR
jgi:hypothetical protein